MEKGPSIGSMIRFSWTRSRELLFPFRFKRWFKILIIVWLAGAGVQGCGMNFNAPAKSSRTSASSPKMAAKQDASTPQQTSAKRVPVSSAGGAQAAAHEEAQTSSGKQTPDSAVKPKWKMDRLTPAQKIGIAAGAVFFILSVVFLMSWLSSRFNFILLDVMLAREPVIGEAFAKHRKAGNSYFLWNLAFMGIFSAALLLAIFLIVIAAGIFKWSAVVGTLVAFLGGLAILAVLAAAIFLGTIMHDFGLPVMYAEGIPAMRALNRCLDADTFAFGKVFQYMLVMLGLGILALIVQSIVGIFAVIGGAFVGGLLAVPWIALIKALPVLKLPLIVLGSFVAIALVLAVIVVISMVMLPVAIFFRMFALTYLTRLYSECDLLGFMGQNPDNPAQGQELTV